MSGSKVYFCRVQPQENFKSLGEKLLRLVEASGLFNKIKDKSLIALKVHFGEDKCTTFIKPPIFQKLAQELKRKNYVSLVETNTLYYGRRMFAPGHIELAHQHGFGKLGLPIIIMDGLRGEYSFGLEAGLNHFKSLSLAGMLPHWDWMIFLSHLKGHMLSGFGGSLKNMGMGCASKEGKIKQHCLISPSINDKKCQRCRICIKICPAGAIKEDEGRLYIDSSLCTGCAQCLAYCRFKAIKINWSEDTSIFQERLIEYAWGVKKVLKNSFYVNFLLSITKECDCMSKEEKGVIPDIGIMASFDPLALDKASVDMINKESGKDLFRELYPEVDYKIQWDYAQQLGIGNLTYHIDEIS